MNILVIAAHPDDEVLGCGGTMARLANEGHSVYILIVGEGITSRYADPSEADPADIQALHTHAKQVGTSLGAADVFLAALPDNRFDTVALLDIVKVIEKYVDELQPEIVYTQHGGDLNIDHQRLYQAVLTATRPMEDCPVKQLYSYEVGSSSEWSFQQFSPVFRPTTYVDITSTLDKKIAAMEMYESEARVFPHPRSPEALTAQAKNRGAQSGLSAAEAFMLVRAIQ